jgi:hypothetical protein
MEPSASCSTPVVHREELAKRVLERGLSLKETNAESKLKRRSIAK